MKKCTVCEKLCDTNNFYNKKSSKDGVSSMCKECAKEQTRIWNGLNKERRCIYSKLYRENNKEKIYNSEKRKVSSRRHREENKDKYRAADKRSYYKNLEKRREKSNNYNKCHQEERNVYAQKQYEINPEKIREKNRQYRSKRRALKKNVLCDLTVSQWQLIKQSYNYCCAYCGKKQQHLTQDHITPLSRGGAHTASNIVPACRSCNSKKGVGSPLKPVQPILKLIV